LTAILLALLAAAGYGVSDFAGGLASRRVNVLRVVVVSYPVGLVGMTLLAPLAGGHLTAQSVWVGLLAGVAGGLAILWFYAALAAGPMSVVSPVTALLVTAIPLGAGVLAGERPGPWALTGAGLAIVAVVLVSREERGPLDEDTPIRFSPKVAWLTVGSGVTFACYFVLLDHVGDDTGLWPLTLARVVATVMVLVAAFFARERGLPSGVPLRLAVGAGVLDVVANVAFQFAVRGGLLSLVAVIAAMYPAATVLLARLVLAERTNGWQRLGLVLAAVSIGLIAGTG
jgi:drug/metabolite transporter (DMT)-like permease